MDLLHAVILGLVEGITEYLPVSSTGHLIITSSLLGLKTPEFRQAVNNFEVVIQGGAILAVIGLYWKRVKSMLAGLVGKDPPGLRLFLNLAIAFVPAAGLGFLLDDLIESYLFFAGPVIAALAIGGLYMILIDRLTGTQRSNTRIAAADDAISRVTPLQALSIGFMQCVAMWPGTSRSMMTITGGMLVGLPAAAAAEFSFLLGLPTLGAACCYKLLKDFTNSHDTGSPTMFETLGTMPCLVGILVAAVSAALAVKWLVSFLNRRGLTPFGIYRLILAAVLGGLILAGVVDITPDAELEPASIQKFPVDQSASSSNSN